MMADLDYTVLVNSTDSFEDCWVPFFTLLATYWPRPYPPIVLNTETKSFAYADLPIRCSRTGAGHKRQPAWGESLLRCLDIIDTEIVLYLQDDYFLYAPVSVAVIGEVVAKMQSRRLECVRLMECDGAGPWHRTADELLWEVDREATYRLSLQAALWNKNALRRYLRGHESPWQFEVWGSRRAKRMDGAIFCLARDLFNDRKGQVVPYDPTGIVQGQWNETVVKGLFAAHGIDVDFSVRGFRDPRGSGSRRKAPLVRRALNRLRSL